MLDDEGRRFAIQDGNQRIAAQFDLMKFNDQKGVSLLSLYVTIGIATVGLALTYFGKDAWLPASAAIGLAGASACLSAGSFFCLKAIKSAKVDMPGRGFDFWRAAAGDLQHDFASICDAYMEEGEAANAGLRRINAEAASRLRWAQWFGIAAPVVAAILGVSLDVASRYC